MVSALTPSNDSSVGRFTIENFQLSKSQKVAAQARSSQSQPRRIQGEFIKAIPLKWIMPAAASPGKVLAVALAIWFQSGRCRKKPFKLTSAVLRRFSSNRKAAYYALQKLEALGLITVERQTGKNSTITVVTGG